MVGKDLDIFAVGALSLNHIYTHQPKIVNIICSLAAVELSRKNKPLNLINYPF
jgi:hypothetical protein